jgi:hypothetical protein
MAQKKMTIETLAAMLNEGFKTTATKADIHRVEERLDGVGSRLGRIETLPMEEQKRKIERLEAQMKKFDDALAVCPLERAAIPWRLVGPAARKR